MIILRINAYHGDAAAAIVRDGELIAAAEEEWAEGTGRPDIHLITALDEAADETFAFPATRSAIMDEIGSFSRWVRPSIAVMEMAKDFSGRSEIPSPTPRRSAICRKS